ncbi:hypothetical protein D4Q85_00640 [bacterium]|nr:MAG: hypothetical protein D4Q85_00640 [bacterium]
MPVLRLKEECTLDIRGVARSAQFSMSKCDIFERPWIFVIDSDRPMTLHESRVSILLEDDERYIRYGELWGVVHAAEDSYCENKMLREYLRHKLLELGWNLGEIDTGDVRTHTGSE